MRGSSLVILLIYFLQIKEALGTPIDDQEKINGLENPFSLTQGGEKGERTFQSVSRRVRSAGKENKRVGKPVLLYAGW